MREYTVYFQFMGKKLKKSYYAESEADARRQLNEELRIDKVERQRTTINNCMDIMEDVLGITK